MPCRRSVFNATLNLDTVSQNTTDKILKTSQYEIYDIYILVSVKTLLRVLKSTTWLDTPPKQIS